MHATIRRYEGVDTTRMSEVVGQVNKTLVPQLRELPGFSGYYLIEAGNGVLSSFGLFETSEQADESKTVVTKWISDENFSTVIPNAPKITSGKVVAHSDGLYHRWRASGNVIDLGGRRGRRCRPRRRGPFLPCAVVE